LQIQQPSLQSVLEVLNILNGIIFIQLGGGKESKLEETEGGVKITEVVEETPAASAPAEEQVEASLD
jgi:hypothetical protein